MSVPTKGETMYAIYMGRDDVYFTHGKAYKVLFSSHEHLIKLATDTGRAIEFEFDMFNKLFQPFVSR